MRKIGSVAACLATAAMLMAGCGSSSDDDSGNAAVSGEAQRPRSAEELVRELYGAIARNDAATACALFTPSGQAEFIEGHGMPTCEAAVDSIANQLDDPDAFANPSIEIDDPNADELDEWCSEGIVVEGYYETNPDVEVAAFGYRRQADGTWAVISYNTSSCGG
jgi:hypothetical protein